MSWPSSWSCEDGHLEGQIIHQSHGKYRPIPILSISCMHEIQKGTEKTQKKYRKSTENYRFSAMQKHAKP